MAIEAANVDSIAIDADRFFRIGEQFDASKMLRAKRPNVIGIMGEEMAESTKYPKPLTSLPTGLLIITGLVPFTFGLLSIPVVSGDYYAPAWIGITLLGFCLPVALWNLSKQLS